MLCLLQPKVHKLIFLEIHFGIQKVLENIKINLHVNPKKRKTKSKT